MTDKNQRQNQAKLLRLTRKIHRTTGASLFVFFLFISISGLFLGWKSHSGGLLLPKSSAGTTSNFKEWLPLDSLHFNACKILKDSVSANLSLNLERVHIYKDKGMVKFVFTENFWEVQLDGATGRLLQIARRRSDFIEKIHDGSILEYYFNTTKGQIKLIYTTIMGTALLVFTITGFWLWYGPKSMRKSEVNALHL